MGLRWRIALALAAIALIATTAVGLIGYRSTSASLVDEVDRSMSEASTTLLVRLNDGRAEMPTRGLLEVYSVRVLDRRGNVVGSNFPTEIDVASESAAVIGSPRQVVRSTEQIEGENVRIHTIGFNNGAVQVARSLDEVDRVLDDVRRRTLLIVVTVSLVAAVMGWMIAGTVAAPLRKLTRAAEQVESSGRLDVEVPGTGTDEVGRLGGAFRNMLGALARSRAEQRRLVQDAGHELRTPLTSLKTNLSVLRRHPQMDADVRRGVLDDLDTEVTELTDLVNELVAVASGELEQEPAERLELAALAATVAERVGRRRSREIRVSTERPGLVEAPPSALDRAITNVVDNACKFDGTGGPIDVMVVGGRLTVLDRGPGVPDGDRERIFDRFHRAEAARSMPGSGLGLSIVREVVERAGGTVRAELREGGGAAIGFELPDVREPTASAGVASTLPPPDGSSGPPSGTVNG